MPAATSWLARTADRRGCAISFYRMPKGSTPEWSGIAGKLILNADNRNGIAQEFLDGMALISAPGGLGMFIAAQIFADETAAKTGFGGNAIDL